MIIDCCVDHAPWGDEAALSVQTQNAIGAACRCLDRQFDPQVEVSLLFCDDARIRTLNSQWRGLDKATNVLSFASDDAGGPENPLLGDIVVAFETVDRESKAQGKTFNDHVTHLIVHGFLHLLGYDHENDEEAETMEGLETAILSKLGIADPYSSQ